MLSNSVELRKLSINDGKEEYYMLQKIGAEENAFHNPVQGMRYADFKGWLEKMEAWSLGEKLDRGFVPQTIYWILLDGKPIGIGKIRHWLTDESRKFGGNIGCALAVDYRGKGYGTEAIKKLINKANVMGINEKLVTIEKYNYASKKMVEKCGGVLVGENTQRWYFKV